MPTRWNSSGLVRGSSMTSRSSRIWSFRPREGGRDGGREGRRGGDAEDKRNCGLPVMAPSTNRFCKIYRQVAQAFVGKYTKRTGGREGGREGGRDVPPIWEKEMPPASSWSMWYTLGSTSRGSCLMIVRVVISRLTRVPGLSLVLSNLFRHPTT